MTERHLVHGPAASSGRSPLRPSPPSRRRRKLPRDRRSRRSSSPSSRRSIPPAALREGREGTVLLDLLVTAAGTVDSVAVAQSLAPDLDAAAVAAARAVRLLAGAGRRRAGAGVRAVRSTPSRCARRRGGMPDVVNFRGRLREMGTRAPLASAHGGGVVPRLGPRRRTRTCRGRCTSSASAASPASTSRRTAWSPSPTTTAGSRYRALPPGPRAPGLPQRRLRGARPSRRR